MATINFKIIKMNILLATIFFKKPIFYIFGYNIFSKKRKKKAKKWLQKSLFSNFQKACSQWLQYCSQSKALDVSNHGRMGWKERPLTRVLFVSNFTII